MKEVKKMKKAVELINFNNYPGKVLTKKLITKKIKPFFSLYTLIDDFTTFNIETINSIFEQTYECFEWVIIGTKKNNKRFEQFLKENNINDSRIIFKNNLENIVDNFDTDYLIKIDFETFLDRTLLETYYSYITYYKKPGVIYTNVISIDDEKTINKIVVSTRKKIINFSSRSFCFRKDIYKNIIKLENNLYKVDGNFLVVHFDFYGIWHKNTQENHIKLKNASFKNFPSSSNYDFNTIPNNETIKLGTLEKNKNILCMIPWHKIGGADLFNYNIFKYLKSKGYNIYVVSTEICNYEARQKLENVVDGFYDLTTFLKRREWANFIKSLIVSKNIDLILQLSSLYGYYLIPWLKYQFPDIPILDYIHVENYAWRNGGFPRDSVAVANYLDKTFCCNKHLEELLYKDMHRKVHNTETMYIGVDTDKYNPDIIEITDEEAKEFCKNKKVILYPCRFCFEKRPLFLLNVLKNISKKRDDIVCLMVGDGEAKEAILKYIKSNNLENVVKIISLKSDIREYYKLANLTFICALFEGITLTTYESLSMNTPVISSDVGGQKEVINNKVGAIIKTFQESKDLMNFNYDKEELKLYEDKVIEILENENYYTENNRCRNYIVENFSIRKIYEEFENKINYYITNGSKVSKDILDNEMFAIQYLVLFNETTKLIFNDNLDLKNAFIDKTYRNNKLWQHWWWRALVKTAKKLKIDVFVKKVFFKEQQTEE